MKYKIDNDLHIHSELSLCSCDAEMNAENILKYARKNGLATICITDHFWDSAVDGATPWYAQMNYEYISKILPLPQAEDVRFLFGCETELKLDLTLGISKERMDSFDFIVIPTTHFHMSSFTIPEESTASAELLAGEWIDRLDAVLDMDLPFHKVGIAHLTCVLIAPEREKYLDVLRALPEDEMKRVFTKAAQRGVGIELNADDICFTDEEADVVLKPYKIAKACGCKFYLGSDAHHPFELEGAPARFERVVDLLELTEDDKFVI